MNHMNNPYSSIEERTQDSEGPSIADIVFICIVAIAVLYIGFITYHHNFVDPTLHQGQLVQVKSGFYSGGRGFVRSYAHTLTGSFQYIVELNRTDIAWVDERDLELVRLK